jgi:hypothetical protein
MSAVIERIILPVEVLDPREVEREELHEIESGWGGVDYVSNRVIEGLSDNITDWQLGCD